MGNHLRGMSLLSNGQFPCQVQLGRRVVIDAKTDVDLGYLSMVWSMSYTVDGSVCALQLSNIRFTVVDILGVEIRDHICFGGGIRLWIKKAENHNDLLDDHFDCFGRFAEMVTIKVTETRNSWGVTKTNVFFYGSGSKGGLVVRELKTKNGDVKPCNATVAHYYAVSSGNVFDQNKVEVGLSTVVHVRALNNALDFTVEGPLQHPSSALFYMFEQVLKTGTWKPMACPHCATIQSQGSGMFKHSESEDSDGISLSRLRGPRQGDAGSVVANNGVIKGNNNGNLIVILKKKLREFVSN